MTTGYRPGTHYNGWGYWACTPTHSKQVKFLCITAADRGGVDHKAQVRVRRRENVAVESDRSYDR